MKFSLYSSWNICRKKKVKEKYQTCCIVSTSRHLLGISYGGPMTVRILLCWWRCHSCLLRISSQVRLTLSFLEGTSPFFPSCCWIWLVLARGRLRPIWMGDIWVVFGSSNLLREQITVQMDNVASCSSNHRVGAVALLHHDVEVETWKWQEIGAPASTRAYRPDPTHRWGSTAGESRPARGKLMLLFYSRVGVVPSLYVNSIEKCIWSNEKK